MGSQIDTIMWVRLWRLCNATQRFSFKFLVLSACILLVRYGAGAAAAAFGARCLHHVAKESRVCVCNSKVHIFISSFHFFVMLFLLLHHHLRFFSFHFFTVQENDLLSWGISFIFCTILSKESEQTQIEEKKRNYCESASVCLHLFQQINGNPHLIV